MGFLRDFLLVLLGLILLPFLPLFERLEKRVAADLRKQKARRQRVEAAEQRRRKKILEGLDIGAEEFKRMVNSPPRTGMGNRVKQGMTIRAAIDECKKLTAK